MGVLDVDELLREVSPDVPCGENLEYDPNFGEMERAARGKEEQQVGDSVMAAEDPDWREVKSYALDLFSRTKDIRVTIYLCAALLRTDGLQAFRDGMELLSRLLTQYWPSIHPQLDAEDDNDPAMRVNALMTLCDADAVLNGVREAALVESPMLGKFHWRHVQNAMGDRSTHAGNGSPEMSVIEAAFMDCELDQLTSLAEDVQQAGQSLRSIENHVTEQVGAAQSPNFEKLQLLLKQIHTFLQDQLQRRGALEDDSDMASAEPGTNGSPTDRPTGARARGVGEINSREDVLRMLEQICEYYERCEPSSPLPLLLKRAKRLASKSFLEIIQDLTPDALDQARAIGGVSDAGATSDVGGLLHGDDDDDDD